MGIPQFDILLFVWAQINLLVDKNYSFINLQTHDKQLLIFQRMF